MKTTIRRRLANALSALALSTTAMTAAYATPQPQFALRAGAIQQFEYSGDERTAVAIAGQFEGLIHVLFQDDQDGQLAWGVWTPDGQQMISVGPAEVDEEEGVLYFGGEMREGSLKGLPFGGVLYFVDEETAAIAIGTKVGNTELVFSQLLESVN